MPAGTDLVTWSPRVGATGDDRYSWASETAITAGSSGGYSSTPTLNEVNAGSGINQIVADIKRRGGTASYVTAGTILDDTAISALKTAIDALRAAEYRSAYSWTAFPISAQTVMRNTLVKELREALATDYVHVRRSRTGQSYSSLIKTGSSYYPSSVIAYGGYVIGQIKTYSHSVYSYWVYRSYDFPLKPTGLPSIGVTKLAYRMVTGAPDTDFDVNVYRSGSDLFDLDTGDWGNLDSLDLTFNTADLTYNEWYDGEISAIDEAGNTLIYVSSRDLSSTPPVYLTNEAIQLETFFKLYTA